MFHESEKILTLNLFSFPCLRLVKVSCESAGVKFCKGFLLLRLSTMADPRGNIYYDDLKKKMDDFKKKNNQRGTKKDITMLPTEYRRTQKLSVRGDTLILNAMELEVQTHCKIHLEMKTEKGKPGKSYRTLGFDSVSNENPVGVAPPPMEAEPSTSDPPLPSTPTRPHQQVVAEPEVVGSNQCQICKKTDSSSFWLGCSHINKVTRKDDCDYWVHQNCVGLHYKSADSLLRVPFFCPPHGAELNSRRKVKKKTTPSFANKRNSILQRYAAKKQKR